MGIDVYSKPSCSCIISEKILFVTECYQTPSSSKERDQNFRRSSLKKNTKPSYLYGIGNASQKIVRHLEKIKLNYELIEKQLTY